MNILSLFPLIPLVMMLGLWISKNTRQIHAVMVAGSSALLALAIYLVFHYLGLREAGATDAMLLTDSVVWYAPLNIHYAVGVDGISYPLVVLTALLTFLCLGYTTRHVPGVAGGEPMTAAKCPGGCRIPPSAPLGATRAE